MSLKIELSTEMNGRLKLRIQNNDPRRTEDDDRRHSARIVLAGLPNNNNMCGAAVSELLENLDNSNGFACGGRK